MKARYKLGTFISFKNNSAQDTGVIDSIITRASGFSYTTESFPDTQIVENDVINAYRPVVARAAKKSVAKKTEKKSKKSSTDLQAAA